jgi:hypothetical protein
MRTTLTILAAVSALAMAGQAAAHARLLSSTPKNGATVAAPSALVMHFSESIELAASSVAVKKADGSALATGALTLDKDKRTVHAPFAAAPAHGAYKAHWHMKTEDGHETDGDVAFTVK